jgi:hypothetical protein
VSADRRTNTPAGAPHQEGPPSARGRAVENRGGPKPRVWRGFVVGLILLPFNALWVLYMEHISAHGPIPSTISLFFNVVFVLFFLALGNGAVRRVRPRWALNQGELIIVYIMLAISTALAGLDGMQVLIPVMTHGFWFANPENRYDQLLEGVPRWLVVADKSILYGYYNGSSSFYQGAIVRAWLTPALWWTGFMVVLVFVMACLSVIVRAQWADRERLTFPIIQLPMAVSEQGTPLWRNPLLWIGFALAGSIDLVNGLHYIYPAIPYLSIAPTLDSGGSNDLMKYIPDLPWAGIGWLPVTFYPAVIGISFLVPLDLLFSSVFFFWFWKLMFVIAAATGVSQGYSEAEKTVFPYVNEQMFGGYIAIALGPMYVGRRYFREVGLRILGRKSEVDDSEEGMSYRTAAIGVVIGVILLVLFAVRGGLSLRLASLFFVIYYLISLAVARVRAEFGSPVHDFHLAGPGQMITYVAGTASMGQRDLSMLSVLWWFNRAYRSHPIGISIEGVQMAHRSRSSSRALIAAIVLATFAGTIAVFWGWLHYAYTLGVGSKWNGGDSRGVEMVQYLQNWVQNPTQPNPGAFIGISAGFVITLLLAAARTAFMGWPLHPVAYALSASWSIHLVWMPMLIAWVAKAMVLRYGGLRLYRQVLPLFYGLILGESVIGCGWPIVGLITGMPTYSFWGL